jgi:uncharacterized protein (TIGR02246 family)
MFLASIFPIPTERIPWRCFMTQRHALRFAAVSPMLFLLALPLLRGAAQEPERAADQAAVRSRMQDFLKTLAKRDAKEVAPFWTATGEYSRGDLTIRGRANIEAAYAEHLKKHEPGDVAIEGESIRFLSDDTAIDEGVFVVKRVNPAESTRNHYSALLVRSGGQWSFGLLRENPETPSLQDLAWLVGSWTFADAGAESRMTVAWTENKAYLLCRTSHKIDDRTVSATQLLALHPGTHNLRSWTFEADGSLGEATWSRTEKGWSAKATSWTADGEKATATTLLSPIDENTFVYQSIDRTVGGEKVADVGPVKATRIPAVK